jgi:ABC-type Zn uptake system ZnuABC Zn-binding protein ZnuA
MHGKPRPAGKDFKGKNVKKTVFMISLPVLVGWLVSGFERARSTSSSEDNLQIVASTSIIGDVVRQVAAKRWRWWF